MPKGCSNPGHGGRDSGALGSRSVEKDINLQVSLKFAKRMRDHGFEMVETRTTDRFMGLSDIVALANGSGCDFFQSNHCNAGHGHGFEIYALPGGRAELHARVMEKYLATALGISDRGVKTDQKFYVLVHTAMPAVLVELAFIDNAAEENLLLNAAWQEKAVEAMVKAWCEIYAVTYRPLGQPQAPPPQTQPAPPPAADKAALVQEALDYLNRAGEVIRKLGE